VAGEREKGECGFDVRGVEDNEEEGEVEGDSSSEDEGLATD
jgi:hypothetical protein